MAEEKRDPYNGMTYEQIKTKLDKKFKTRDEKVKYLEKMLHSIREGGRLNQRTRFNLILYAVKDLNIDVNEIGLSQDKLRKDLIESKGQDYARAAAISARDHYWAKRPSKFKDEQIKIAEQKLEKAENLPIEDHIGRAHQYWVACDSLRILGRYNKAREVFIRALEETAQLPEGEERENETDDIVASYFCNPVALSENLKKMDDYLKEHKKDVARRQLRMSKRCIYNAPGIEGKLTGIISIAGLGAAIFFLSSNITGNVVGSQTTSNLIGSVLLVVGLVAGFFWLKAKKKKGNRKRKKK